VPTKSGYRRYVDAIRESLQIKRSEARRLASEYDKHISTIEEVIERTSLLISRELHNAGIVMWPGVDDLYLKRMELVKLRAENVLAILVTMTNAVTNYIVKLDQEMEKRELERISNFINEKYEHLPLSEISAKLKDGIKRTRQEDAADRPLAVAADRIMDSVFLRNAENEMYWSGLDNFMNDPGRRNMDGTRIFFDVFAEKEALMRLLRSELPSRELKVYIDGENMCEKLSGCSLVTSGYTMRGKIVGRLGVIGPARMDYARALSTVSCLAELISDKLKEIEE
jgi:heat-inducible transcriptional repressor